MLFIFIFGLNQPREGNGLGLKDTGYLISSKYLSAKVVYQTYQDNVTETIKFLDHSDVTLIGHSFGGGKCVQTANELNDLKIPVRQLTLLDPVPVKGWGIFNFKDFQIPDNVKNAKCFLRKSLSRIGPPWSCPIRKCQCPYENTEKWWTHNEFCSKDEVRQYILKTA